MDEKRPVIQEHCRRLGLVGEALIGQLADQLPSRLLLPRGRQPVLLTGQAGSGRTLVSRLVHEVTASTLQRNGELIAIDCAASRRILERLPSREGLLDLAADGTLVLDGIEQLTNRSQEGLGDLLRHRAEDPTLPAAAPVLVLIADDHPTRLAREGQLGPALAAQLPEPLVLEPLCLRGKEIQELAAHFLHEAARTHCPGRSLQFTRRALSDLRQAMEQRQIASVAELRDSIDEIVRAGLASGTLLDRISSEALLPCLGVDSLAALNELQASRDLAELATGLPAAIDEAFLIELAERHAVPRQTLEAYCQVVQQLVTREGDGARLSYQQVTERVRVLSRVALWLVSGSHTQSDFRRFFGSESWQMPTKSVAWAIFHEVVGEGAEGGER